MIRPALLVALAIAALAALAAGCGNDTKTSAAGNAAKDGPAPGGSAAHNGPEHVHGLGVNPADDALYIATHNGLWRAPAGSTGAAPVGEISYDLMGFTVAGPDRFLASGHPDVGSDLPAQLGLQRSTDRGRSWKPVSLVGAADLHVLRAADDRIYGIDSGTRHLLTSGDAGRSWEQRKPPAATFDLAIDPRDAQQVLAASEQGLFRSADEGRTWRRLNADVAGLLAWPSADALYLVGGDGTVARSTDGGKTFRSAGSVGTRPEAFAAAGPRELYAAVGSGRVRVSTDGGASWQTRAMP